MIMLSILMVQVIEHMQTAKTAPTLDGTKTLLEAIVSIELSHPSVVHTYKFDTIPVTVSLLCILSMSA